LSNDTEHKFSGTDCLSVGFQNAQGTVTGFYHLYGSNQNWSTKSSFCFYMYGNNSGQQLQIGLSNDANSSTTIGVGWYYLITDNFVGLRKFYVPFSALLVNTGSPSLTTIRKVVCKAYTSGGSFTVYFDRWILDSITGVSAVDYSGNSNNGATTGTSITDSKWVGKTARQINGTTDHVNCGNDTALRPTDELTVVAWMKQTQEKTNSWELTIAGSEDTARGFILRGGKSTVFGNCINLSAGNGTVWTDGVWPAYNFQLNTWYHVAGTVKSNDKIRVYVNGNEVGNGDFSGNLTSSTVAFWLGSTQIYPTRTYAGLISNTLLFNRALSATEIETLSSDYPDASLIPGSVCVRKWATTSLPIFGEWSV
jgi:hypothetical protein